MKFISNVNNIQQIALTGSLAATASVVLNASYATSSSYADTTISSSYAKFAVSSSYHPPVFAQYRIAMGQTADNTARTAMTIFTPVTSLVQNPQEHFTLIQAPELTTSQYIQINKPGIYKVTARVGATGANSVGKEVALLHTRNSVVVSGLATYSTSGNWVASEWGSDHLTLIVEAIGGNTEHISIGQRANPTLGTTSINPLLSSLLIEKLS